MKTLISFTLALTLTLISLKTTAQTNEQAQEMLKLVNDLRAENGRSPVFLNDKLNLASKNHSQDMANNNYFEHEGLNGSSFSTRITNVGYTGSPRAENIAAGNINVKNVFNQWVNSSGHLKNMLNSNINEMGIGYGFNSSAQYSHYWTQVFALNRSLSTKNDSLLTFSTYPNPINDVLYVKTSQNMVNLNYKIYAFTGQLIEEKKVNRIDNVFTIDVNHLSKGIYLIQLGDNTIKKLIKN